MNQNSSFSLSNHPYIISGIVSTLIYILVSLYLKKKNLKSSLVGALIFGLWFMLGWLAWNYFGDSKSTVSNIENTSNRYMTGLVGSLVWFLYCLVLKKMNLAKSLASAGLFLIFYIVAEIVYTLLSDKTL